MNYRNLGKSGVKVSPLCLGTMNFGGPTDEATAARLIAKAREQGVNFIDSADAYQGGKSEEIAGRAIGNQRHDWVVATKLANQIGEGANRGGLSGSWTLDPTSRSTLGLVLCASHSGERGPSAGLSGASAAPAT